MCYCLECEVCTVQDQQLIHTATPMSSYTALNGTQSCALKPVFTRIHVTTTEFWQSHSAENTVFVSANSGKMIYWSEMSVHDEMIGIWFFSLSLFLNCLAVWIVFLYYDALHFLMVCGLVCLRGIVYIWSFLWMKKYNHTVLNVGKQQTTRFHAAYCLL